MRVREGISGLKSSAPEKRQAAGERGVQSPRLPFSAEGSATEGTGSLREERG